jgi:signal transduction histidine kinase
MTARFPRSLAAQLTLLIAIALFVAQAINFAMLLRERRSFAMEQIAGPAATRFIDAIERNGIAPPLPPPPPSPPPPRIRLAGGRPAGGRPAGGRPAGGPVPPRVRLLTDNPIGPVTPREPGVEDALRGALREAGIQVGRIATGLAPLDPRDPMLRRMPPHRAERLARNADVLVIAVQRPAGGWLVQRMPWVRADAGLVWRLILQTAILFALVLLSVLWAVRRLARPLRALTHAAQSFGPGDVGSPLAVTGPDDVAQLIAAFNALRLRVTAMLDEKDRMLGAIGHDLRTPLAALRVRIESVEDETDRAKMADTVAEMNRTLDDILSLARLGRPSEAATEVDVAALVDAVVEDFRDLGQDVTFVEAARLPIRLRPSLMRRAVRNLVENAIKYGHNAVVSVEAGPRTVAIHVADGGPGIPEDRLGDVFEAFTRLETSRNRDTGGIGLGLALARAIVREANGDVTLANRPEGGLMATITLPR